MMMNSKYGIMVPAAAALAGYVLGFSSSHILKWFKTKSSKFSKSNHAYIVGAGPGDKQYLTCIARDLIESAHVLLVDALVDPSIVSLARNRSNSTTIIYVGKRGGDKQHSIAQSDLNALLVRYAQDTEYGCVVRLKGGDPGIFGRVYEETQALERANCTYEIISGISSILAAPNAMNLPLTHVDWSKSVVFVSGHAPEKLNFKQLSQIDTILIVMGTRTWEALATGFLEAGVDPTTPVALIHSCYRKGQEFILRADLSGLSTKLQECRLSSIKLSPAVIVIGKVASLAKDTQ